LSLDRPSAPIKPGQQPAASGDRPGQRLLLDTMIAHALTVVQAAGRLARPVPVLR
jgi:hypothetical protein